MKAGLVPIDRLGLSILRAHEGKPVTLAFVTRGSKPIHAALTCPSKAAIELATLPNPLSSTMGARGNHQLLDRPEARSLTPVNFVQGHRDLEPRPPFE